MRPIIYPYNFGSRSARHLAEALRPERAKRVRADGNYKPFHNHLIVNWGCSQIPKWLPPVFGGKVLNHFALVKTASNKLDTFEALQDAEISIPEFTTDHKVAALEWCLNGDLIGRKILNGHGGAGIELIPKQEDHWDAELDGIVDAWENSGIKLYVKYIKKAAEYRVHVFKGKVLDVQQKLKRKDFEGHNNQIRNYHNGWIYARNIDPANEQVVGQAVAAVAALGLDFGAVDVIWNNHYQKAYVLEVNTAPGLEGETINIYANAIRELL